MVSVDRVEADRRFVCRVRGELTSQDVRTLEAVLRETTVDGWVVLDCAGAPSLADVAVGLLAPALSSCPAHRLEVRGLSRHQYRLLRYLGVGTNDDPARAVG